MSDTLDLGYFRRLSDSSADKAVMEMANLITNPGDVPGATVPSSGMKRADSSEALNLTLHQVSTHYRLLQGIGHFMMGEMPGIFDPIPIIVLTRFMINTHN